MHLQSLFLSLYYKSFKKYEICSSPIWYWRALWVWFRFYRGDKNYIFVNIIQTQLLRIRSFTFFLLIRLSRRRLQYNALISVFRSMKASRSLKQFQYVHILDLALYFYASSVPFISCLCYYDLSPKSQAHNMYRPTIPINGNKAHHFLHHHIFLFLLHHIGFILMRFWHSLVEFLEKICLFNLNVPVSVSVYTVHTSKAHWPLHLL